MDLDKIRSERLASLELTHDQIECLVSAVRNRMLNLFALHGPCSIADIAQLLGTYPEGLYHHTKKLIAVGLLRDVGTRRRGRKDEVVLDSMAQRSLLKPKPWDDAYIAAISRLFKSSFRLSLEDCEHAVAKFGASPVANAYQYVRRMDIEMDVAKVEELRKRIKELDAWLASKPQSEFVRAHTFFMSISALDN